jgi:hypothetical protein
LRAALVVLTVVAAFSSFGQPARAHLGRRLRIDIEGGKLVARGVNTGTPDGAPEIRPFEGAVHDHWRNFHLPELPTPDFATTFLPEFDLPASVASLQHHSLSLRLVDAFQWAHPQLSHHGSTTPHFQPLDDGEVIRIEGADNTSTTTDQLGSFTLLQLVPPGGDPDIPVAYHINGHPDDEIHVLKFILSATNLVGPTTIAASDPIYVLLAPDGATHAEKLHHEALFLSEYMASLPVPEPGGLGLSILGLLAVFARTRRQRSIKSRNYLNSIDSARRSP